ncbi:glycerol 2-dehydrogenase (NADP(+)) [Trichomonascus vanleenenianus]|uniref:aldo/keto reductase n=1 Tax=Trichomonascus vanleenenianus TaxID=2268995 RepID=UPI003ECB4265
MTAATTIRLNNGVEMPVVGMGTAKAVGNDCYESVKTALELGYRLIDTAAQYKNEDQVGRAIRDSAIPRKEIFLTTKLYNWDHKRVAQAFEESLQRLGVDYVDLYLIHWPAPLKPGSTADVYDDWTCVDTWKQMQKIYLTGRARAIGVSNFDTKQLRDLLAHPATQVVPAVNQVELHPLLPQDTLVQYCHDKNIAVTAYSPLGASATTLLSDPVITSIARTHDVQPSQIVLSWNVARDVAVIPKSVKRERLLLNLTIVDLTDDEVDKINDLHKTHGVKRVIHPKFNSPLFQDDHDEYGI